MRKLSRLRSSSVRKCALVAIGCGVGLTLLKEPPSLLNNATATVTRRATTISSSVSSPTFPTASLQQGLLDDSLPPGGRLDRTVSSSEGSKSGAEERRRANATMIKAGPSRPMAPRMGKKGANATQRSDRTAVPTTHQRSTNRSVDAGTAKATADPRPTPRPREFYSLARTDRAGSSINHMVVALAHGFATNTTYMGACYRREMVDGVKRQADKVALIRAAGLQDLIRFACPGRKRRDLICEDFITNWPRLLSPEFVAWLRSRVVPIPPAPGGLAVVHVRRGDVDPCQYKDRYLPASYYVDVLRRHVPAAVPVVVFSESTSFEPFTEFEALRLNGTNVTIRLDTDVAEVWGSVLAASHVVTSRSTFAYVPSILNANATILYPSEPLQRIMPYWKCVDADILQRSALRVDELAAQHCHNYTSVWPGFSFYNSTPQQRLSSRVFVRSKRTSQS